MNGLKYTVPTKVINPINVSAWTDIDAGSAHTCGIGDIQAYCWGNGGAGQIGIDGTVNVDIPTAVINPPDVTSWMSITAGVVQSCGISDNNQGYCWGSNSRQNANFETIFGVGNSVDSIINTPTLIVNP